MKKHNIFADYINQNAADNHLTSTLELIEAGQYDRAHFSACLGMEYSQSIEQRLALLFLMDIAATAKTMPAPEAHNYVMDILDDAYDTESRTINEEDA